MRNTAGMNFYRQGVCAVFVALFSAIVFCGVSRAEDAVGMQSLGEGLAYFRVTDLAGQLPDLEKALAANAALVVDLRGVSANMTSAKSLRSALLPVAAKEKERVARFVLINGTTASAIPFVLDAGLPDGGVPGVVTFAPVAASVPADVKVAGTVEDDARACEAIAKGVVVATLFNQQPEKKRYDEAVLVREHQGVPEPEVAADEGASESSTEKKSAVKSDVTKPVSDAVLQVAVQTHRALVALKKL